MKFLDIVEDILTIAPSGIQLTNEVIGLFKALEAAFQPGGGSLDNQKAVVSALGAHLASKQ
ncbi:MAG TPA: hypothetical protein VFW83_02600 [Bryobacteraceae bacterium]|nr:hypothetical protein [Bryobacteraceae bacterium]